MSAQATHGDGDSEDELSGLYSANSQSGGSLYPPSVEAVEVRTEVDGYHDILLLDAAGRIVFTDNRAAYRIRGALEGGEGYDIVVRGAA